MERKRYESLNGLRTFAFLLIFAWHTKMFLSSVVTQSGMTANWAVSCFFMLSGFLTGLTDRGGTRDEPVGRYLWRKILRFYPLYVVTIFLSAQFLQCDYRYDVLGWHFLLWQCWNPSVAYYYNGLAWFLSTMMFLYAAMRLIMPYLRRVSNQVLIGLMAVLFLVHVPLVMALTCVPAFADGEFAYMSPIARLPECLFALAAGLLVSRCDRPMDSSRKGIALWTVFECACCAALIVAPAFGARMHLPWTVSMAHWALPTTGLLVACVRGTGLVSRVLSDRRVAFLGGLTMPCYLIHQNLVENLLWRLQVLGVDCRTKGVTFQLLTFIGLLVATFLLSYVWTRVVRFLKERIPNHA